MMLAFLGGGILMIWGVGLTKSDTELSCSFDSSILPSFLSVNDKDSYFQLVYAVGPSANHRIWKYLFLSSY